MIRTQGMYYMRSISDTIGFRTFARFLHNKLLKVRGQNGMGRVTISCRKLNNEKENQTVTIFTEL